MKSCNHLKMHYFQKYLKITFSGYWLRHTDKVDPTTKKVRLELNFVYANVDLISGNALTVAITQILIINVLTLGRTGQILDMWIE